VILYTGDEAVRTRLRRKLISSDPLSCDDPLVQLFLRDFSEQHLAENELDLSSVSYKKEERLFEYCLRQFKVLLTGTVSHHGNHSRTPVREPVTSSHVMSSLSHDPMTTNNNMMRLSPHHIEGVEGTPLGVDDSIATGWSVQPKRIVLPPRPDRLGMLIALLNDTLNYNTKPLY